jgi:hypothetical protein
MDHLSDLRNIVNEPVIEFVANVKAGEHGCIFFTSKEVMKDIQFVFVKSGLENNWGVVYATATESIEQVRYSMKNYGIDTARFEGNDSLIIIKGEDLYKNPENPDLENWKSVAKSISQKFIANGKKGVRIAADLSSYFLSKGLTKQWFDLEYALERKIALPISVVCGYNIIIPGLWDIDILRYYKKINEENKEYVDAHSFVIYASKYKNKIFTI